MLPCIASRIPSLATNPPISTRGPRRLRHPGERAPGGLAIFGAPGKQGGCARRWLTSSTPLAAFQTNGCLLKGKVGSAFTSVGGSGTGYGGHEAILQSFHAFLQHGTAPRRAAEPDHGGRAAGISFGTCMSGKPEGEETGSRLRSLSESEVKIRRAQWSSIITKQLHDTATDNAMNGARANETFPSKLARSKPLVSVGMRVIQ